MSLAALYQEVILDHNKNPRNFGMLEQPTHQAQGHNPLCGDQLLITLIIDDNLVKQIMFTGAGCAICMSSASLLTEAVIGKELTVVHEQLTQVIALLLGNEVTIDLGKLTILKNVNQYPARVKCATLAWHTLSSALACTYEAVTTE